MTAACAPPPVFGLLSLLRSGEPVSVEGIQVPVPRTAGLLLEKLATERSGEKGDRDLLVALGLLLVAGEADLTELAATYRGLAPELRHAVRANLATLALLGPLPDMPDPTAHRLRVTALRRRLERGEEDG